MIAFVGEGVLSPLPGLGVHGGTEPSAHALGYRLPALRASGHGLEACCVSRTATPIPLHGLVGMRSVSRGDLKSAVETTDPSDDSDGQQM